MKIIAGILILLCTLVDMSAMRTQEDSVKKPRKIRTMGSKTPIKIRM